MLQQPSQKICGVLHTRASHKVDNDRTAATLNFHQNMTSWSLSASQKADNASGTPSELSVAIGPLGSAIENDQPPFSEKTGVRRSARSRKGPSRLAYGKDLEQVP